jgi:hypothetical protein
VQTVYDDADEIRALFSPARWEEFKRDVAFFRSKVSSSLWQRMINDKGYNATPIWTMVSGTLSNMASTDDMAGLTGIAMLDVCWAIAAFACLWWAFGHRVALLVVIFMTTHYLTSHFTLKAAFLRLDWIMCLVISTCLLKKKQYSLAGIFTAYATASRVFPLLFAFGLGANGLWKLIRTRKIDWLYFRYFLAFGLTLWVLFLASILYHGSFEPWRDFLAKVAQHNSDISGWRIGFKYIFLMSYNGAEFWGRDLKLVFDDMAGAWWAIQACMLLSTLFLVQKLEDYEAFIFGIIPVFFLTSATYYYYVMLIVPFIFFVAKLERPARFAGVVLMFVTAMAGHLLYARWNRTYTLFFTMTCLIAGMILYMAILAIAEYFRKNPPEPEPAGKEAVAEDDSPAEAAEPASA